MNIPSLANPPNAPKKKVAEKSYLKDFILRTFFLPTDPHAPRTRLKKKYDLTPISLDFDVEELIKECNWLQTREEVRETLVIKNISEIMEETNKTYLECLRDLHLPTCEATNVFEQAYISNVMDIVSFRLDTFHM
ncbi:MAG: hypothetical protein AAFO96_29690 [Bacteroidota bacterium]